MVGEWNWKKYLVYYIHKYSYKKGNGLVYVITIMVLISVPEHLLIGGIYNYLFPLPLHILLALSKYLCYLLFFIWEGSPNFHSSRIWAIISAA